MRLWPGACAWGALTAATMVAIAGDWAASWESIRATSQSVRSIEAEFVQKRALKILSRPILSRGALVFRRPGDLRWEYASPVESILVARNGSVERFIRRDGKLVPDSSARLDAMGAVIGEINQWLSGDFSSSKVFRSELRRTGGANAVVLTPNEPGMQAIIQSVTLKLGERPGMVSSIVIDEGKEGSTTIDFTEVRLNGDVGDDRFIAK